MTNRPREGTVLWKWKLELHVKPYFACGLDAFVNDIRPSVCDFPFNYLALLLQACESVLREDLTSEDIETHMVDVWDVDSW